MCIRHHVLDCINCVDCYLSATSNASSPSASKMVDVLRRYVLVLLAVSGVSHASITSKCRELLLVPSDSAPAVVIGTAQEVLADDKDGRYGVVISLQQVISGQDVMKDILSFQGDLQR